MFQELSQLSLTDEVQEAHGLLLLFGVDLGDFDSYFFIATQHFVDLTRQGLLNEFNLLDILTKFGVFRQEPNDLFVLVEYLVIFLVRFNYNLLLQHALCVFVALEKIHALQ